MKGIDKIRHCEICGNQLSRYNPGKICFHHQPGMPIVEHSPITLCTGYEKSAQTESAPNFYLQPGDPGYNELAFTESIIGVVNDDGEAVDLNF